MPLQTTLLSPSTYKWNSHFNIINQPILTTSSFNENTTPFDIYNEDKYQLHSPNIVRGQQNAQSYVKPSMSPLPVNKDVSVLRILGHGMPPDTSSMRSLQRHEGPLIGGYNHRIDEQSPYVNVNKKDGQHISRGASVQPHNLNVPLPGVTEVVPFLEYCYKQDESHTQLSKQWDVGKSNERYTLSLIPEMMKKTVGGEGGNTAGEIDGVFFDAGYKERFDCFTILKNSFCSLPEHLKQLHQPRKEGKNFGVIEQLKLLWWSEMGERSGKYYVYFWNYQHPNNNVQIEEFESPIVSIGYTRLKGWMTTLYSDNSSQCHGLFIALTNEIRLCSVSILQGEQISTSIRTIFSDTLSAAAATCVASHNASGRIFFGDTNGHIYEYTYRMDASKTKKSRRGYNAAALSVHRTISKINGGLKDFVHRLVNWSFHPSITALVSDEMRGLVWGLNEASDVTMIHVPLPIITLNYVEEKDVDCCTLTRSTIQHQIELQFKKWTNEPANLFLQNFKEKWSVVGIHPTTVYEDERILCILIDNFGGRAYIEGDTPENTQNQTTGCLPLNLRVNAYRFPPSMKGEVVSSFNFQGVCFMIHSNDVSKSDQHTTEYNDVGMDANQFYGGVPATPVSHTLKSNATILCWDAAQLAQRQSPNSLPSSLLYSKPLSSSSSFRSYAMMECNQSMDLSKVGDVQSIIEVDVKKEFASYADGGTSSNDPYDIQSQQQTQYIKEWLRATSPNMRQRPSSTHPSTAPSPPRYIPPIGLNELASGQCIPNRQFFIIGSEGLMRVEKLSFSDCIQRELYGGIQKVEGTWASVVENGYQTAGRLCEIYTFEQFFAVMLQIATESYLYTQSLKRYVDGGQLEMAGWLSGSKRGGGVRGAGYVHRRDHRGEMTSLVCHGGGDESMGWMSDKLVEPSEGFKTPFGKGYIDKRRGAAMDASVYGSAEEVQVSPVCEVASHVAFTLLLSEVPRSKECCVVVGNGSNTTYRGRSMTPSIPRQEIHLPVLVKASLLYISRLIRFILYNDVFSKVVGVHGILKEVGTPLQDEGMQPSEGGSVHKRGRALYEEQQEMTPVCLIGKFSHKAVIYILERLEALRVLLDLCYGTAFEVSVKDGTYNKGDISSSVKYQNIQIDETKNRLEMMSDKIDAKQKRFLELIASTYCLVGSASEFLTSYLLLTNQEGVVLKEHLWETLSRLNLQQILCNQEVRRDLREIIFQFMKPVDIAWPIRFNGYILTQSEWEIASDVCRLMQEYLSSNTSAEIIEVKSRVKLWVESLLKGRLMQLSLAPLLNLLIRLKLYDLIAELVVSKAEHIRMHWRLVPKNRYRSDASKLNTYMNTEEALQDDEMKKEIFLNSYRHLGDCLSHLYRMFMDNQNATACRSSCEALVNACLSRDDPSLHYFIFEWILREGLGAFPKPVIQLNSIHLSGWLQANQNIPELHLGEYYIISKQFKLAIDFYYNQACVNWDVSTTIVSEQSPSTTPSISTLSNLIYLSSPAEMDPYCTPETAHLWEDCVQWLHQEAHHPTLLVRKQLLEKALEASRLQQREGTALPTVEGRTGMSNRGVQRGSGKSMSIVSGGSSNIRNALGVRGGLEIHRIEEAIKMVDNQMSLLLECIHLFVVFSYEYSKRWGSGPLRASALFENDTSENRAEQQRKGPFIVLKEIMIAAQSSIWNSAELLRMLNRRAFDSRIVNNLEYFFPFVTAVELLKNYGLILTDRSVVTIELVMRSFLTFSEMSSIMFDNTLIFESALDQLFKVANGTTRDAALLSSLAIAHRYSERQWRLHDGNAMDVIMKAMVENGRPKKSCPMKYCLWPSHEMSKYSFSWKELIFAYMELRENPELRSIASIAEAEMECIFVWLFQSWLVNTDRSTSNESFARLFDSFESKGDLPHFEASSLLHNLPISDIKRQYAYAAVSALKSYLKDVEEAASMVHRQLPSLGESIDWNENIIQFIIRKRNELNEYENLLSGQRLY